MSILVRGGRVLDPTTLSLIEADVLIEGDTIRSVGPDLPAPPGARVIEALGRILLPGLVNCHTHAHNNLLKGMADNWTLEDARNFARALYANWTPEEQYASAAVGALEMLKSGCTAVYDLFTALPLMTQESAEAVIQAYADVGLRAVLAPSMSDLVFYRAVPGLIDLLPPDLRNSVEAIQAAPTVHMLRITEEVIRRWDGAAEGRIRMATAPSVPGECSEEYLSGCVRLMGELGAGFHTHLAETKVQAVYAIERWGKPLVHRLAETGAVSPGFVGAHSVWITEDEIAILAAKGGAVSHNPASNLKLGSGIAPVREMLDAGLTVGLGADGSMSSDNQNMFESMRFAALIGKVRFPHHPERWVGSRDAWRMATTEGAKVLGLGDQIGAIEVGRKADIVMLRRDPAFLQPINDIINALVYSETGADVETVLVGGRVILDGGRALNVDEGKLRARAQAASDSIRTRSAESLELCRRLQPFVRAACRTCATSPYPVNRYASGG